MISEHAMLILMLLLAVAVVVLAVGFMLYAGKVEGRLKGIAEQLKEFDAKAGRTGSEE